MIGEMIGNHRILQQIGQGGMGTVFQAEDTQLGRKVAVKILNPSLLTKGGKELERFQSEAKVQANLNHANVVTLYGFEPYKDSYAMIMEYVEGRTLSELVRTFGALPPGIVVQLSKQVLEGLSAAHRQGVVHRDLKPSNIMLTADGVAKVMDFGIAKVEGGKNLTASGALVGTVFYMSPEQVRGEPVDARSDLYSFGIILFELLTGRVPFKDESDFQIMIHHVQTPPPPPTQLLPAIPSDLEDIVMVCLSKQPDQRFQSAAAVLGALESFEEQERALGRGEIFSRRALIEWLAAPGGIRPAEAAVPAPSSAQAPRSPVDMPRPSQISAPPAPPAGLFDTQPSASRPAPRMPAAAPAPMPVSAKKSGGKGLLVAAAVVIVGLAAGAAWYWMRGRPAADPLTLGQEQPATSQAQATLPPITTPPAGTQPGTTTPPSGQAASATAPAGSTQGAAPGMTGLERPPAEKLSADRATPPAPPQTRTSPSGASALSGAGKPPAVKSASGAAAPPVRSGAAAGAQAAAGSQIEPAVTKAAGGFLVFIDQDQGSERLSLAAAQARVAEIVREAGHQVVSGGVVASNVRAALDRNDLAEVRRNGVGYVILGTANASLEPQTAYGSTYYVAQVSVNFELTRMSDGGVASTGSSNARSKGSANASAALNEALMTATSDAARELLRNIK